MMMGWDGAIRCAMRWVGSFLKISAGDQSLALFPFYV